MKNITKNTTKIFFLRILVFVLSFCIIQLICRGVQWFLKNDGTAKVNAVNTNAIHSISAAGINAALCDHYDFPANEISFTDDVEFSFVDGDVLGIQFQDSNGEWVFVDELDIRPIQDVGYMVFPDLPERVDYEISTSSTLAEEEGLSPTSCTMQYSHFSGSKFRYSITAPCVEVCMYFQDEIHTDESDTFYVDIFFDDCIVTCENEEITGPLRILVRNYRDSYFQNDIWSGTGFVLANWNNDACITNTFSGSDSIEEVLLPDRFEFGFVSEIDAEIEGTLEFRYGTNATEHKLISDRLHLQFEKEVLENKKNAQEELMRIGVVLYENALVYESDAFDTELVIMSVEKDQKRITSFEFSGTVDIAEINGISLFPNLKTLLVDNAMNVGLFSLIFSLIISIFSKPEKVINLPAKGKERGKKSMPKTDAIIILGHRLEPGCKPSEDLIRRIDAAVAHWKETDAPIIMPCGGITPGHDKTEAEVMREMLIERGVPAEIIHLEDRSRITIENILNAKALLGEGKNIALVSSDYHVERALQDCARAGLIAYGVGAVTPEGPYRDQMYATEKRIAEEMAAYRAKGMTDQDITNSIVERMKKRGAVTKEELEKKGE